MQPPKARYRARTYQSLVHARLLYRHHPSAVQTPGELPLNPRVHLRAGQRSTADVQTSSQPIRKDDDHSLSRARAMSGPVQMAADNRAHGVPHAR